MPFPEEEQTKYVFPMVGIAAESEITDKIALFSTCKYLSTGLEQALIIFLLNKVKAKIKGII
jgi:hypothetical protein